MDRRSMTPGLEDSWEHEGDTSIGYGIKLGRVAVCYSKFYDFVKVIRTFYYYIHRICGLFPSPSFLHFSLKEILYSQL